MAEVLFYPRVRFSVRHHVGLWVMKLEALMTLPKGLVIHVVPHASVGPDDDPRKAGFGLYVYPGVFKVYVAGECPFCLEPDVWLSDGLPNVLIHELCHAEQEALGKPIQERGVRLRQRALAKAIGVSPELTRKEADRFRLVREVA